MKVPVAVTRWFKFMNLKKIFGIVGRKGGFFFANRFRIALLFMATVDGFKRPMGCPFGPKQASISALTLAYLVSPIDLVPDFIPFLGSKDDEIALRICIYFTKKQLREYRNWKSMQPLLSEKELLVLEKSDSDRIFTEQQQ